MRHLSKSKPYIAKLKFKLNQTLLFKMIEISENSERESTLYNTTYPHFNFKSYLWKRQLVDHSNVQTYKDQSNLQRYNQKTNFFST